MAGKGILVAVGSGLLADRAVGMLLSCIGNGASVSGDDIVAGVSKEFAGHDIELIKGKNPCLIRKRGRWRISPAPGSSPATSRTIPSKPPSKIAARP